MSRLEKVSKCLEALDQSAHIDVALHISIVKLLNIQNQQNKQTKTWNTNKSCCFCNKLDSPVKKNGNKTTHMHMTSTS